MGSVSFIDESAFENCSSLKDILIPTNVSCISYNSFSGRVGDLFFIECK